MLLRILLRCAGARNGRQASSDLTLAIVKVLTVIFYALFILVVIGKRCIARIPLRMGMRIILFYFHDYLSYGHQDNANNRFLSTLLVIM